MWLLTSNSGKRIYLRIPEIVKIGRKQANITLQNDTSISRLHAVISVKRMNGLKGDNVTSQCTLRDNNSKYGTFLIENGQAIEIPKDGYVLKDKDTIRFGLQNSIYTVSYIPFITSTSSLSANDQCHLEVAIEKIDGLIISGWTEDCTHLTVTSATLTEKTVCALAFGMCIVTIDYWHAVHDAVENSSEIPDAQSYTPQLNETSIDKDSVSLVPNKDRRSLFAGLTFVFFDAKQFKAYGRMILMAGGNSTLYGRRPLEIKKMCASNIIVIRCQEGSSQSQSSQFSRSSQDYQTNKEEYAAVCDALKERKRRTVLDSEIALAVLHCSKETYCNPKFLFENMLKSSQRSSDKYKNSDVIELDTQDVSVNISPRQLPKIISEIRIRNNANIPEMVKKQTDNISDSLEKVCIPETADACDTQTSSVEYVQPANIKTSLENKNVYEQLKNTKCITLTPVSPNDAKKRLRPMSSDEEVTVTPIRSANFVTSTPLCGETANKRAKTASADKEIIVSVKSATDVTDSCNFAKPQKQSGIILPPHPIVNEKAAGEMLIGKDETVAPAKAEILGSSGDGNRDTSKTLADKNTAHVPSKDIVFTTSSTKPNQDATKIPCAGINTLVTSVKTAEFVTSTPLPSMNHDAINSQLINGNITVTPLNNADFVTSTPLPANENDNNPSKAALENNTDNVEKNTSSQASVSVFSNKDTEQLQAPQKTQSPVRVENKGSDNLAEPANVSGRNGLSGSTSSREFHGWIDITVRPSSKTISDDEQADSESSSEKASTPTAFGAASPAKTSPAKTTSLQDGTMHTFLRPAPGRKTFTKAKVPVPKRRISFLSSNVMASTSHSTHSTHSIRSSRTSHSSDSD